MRALVISGGGNKLSIQLGIASQIKKLEDKEYDIIVGTSAGAIVGPCYAADIMESRLIPVMEKIKDKDIFDFYPFKHTVKGVTKINWSKVLFRRIMLGKRTWGSSRPLLDIIKEDFTPTEYYKIMSNYKYVGVTTCSIQDSELNYFKAGYPNNYEIFTKAMWASANFPPFMSTVSINGQDHVDGGLREHLPLQKAIDLGATEIDVINTKGLKTENFFNNSFDLIMAMLKISNLEVQKDDLKKAKFKTKTKTIVRVFNSISELTPLRFHPSIHKRLFREGIKCYDECKHNTYVVDALEEFGMKKFM